MDAEAVNEFKAITGASEHTATFYLDQCQGDLQEAIEHYFANGGKEAPAVPSASGPAAAGGAAGQQGRTAQPASRPPAPGNIRGFGDLGGGEDREEEEEDEDNEYYAGGAKSGVAVRGGPREGSRDHVADLFDQARRAGAEEARPEDLEGPGGSGFRAFSGGARTLAGAPVEPAAAQQATGGPQVRRVNVVFYRNGIFTVDGGEPRNVMDPANRAFLEAIQQGRCPPELDQDAALVDVNLIQKHEDYTPPKVVAFAGTGRRLAGGSAGASTSGGGAAPTNVSQPSVAWEGADESQPTTSIQLRLADGSRMVAKFNLTHTVGDIRRFIQASRPDQRMSYRLVTAFPAAQLDDDSATIESAGLTNSVIIQKA
ncbi:hypothetical protein N2152v2_008966 [Parachlorella kessleri]